MARPLRLTVLTPAEALLDLGEAAWVQVHLADGGPIGIYPGHAPLLAETVGAPLRYADPSGEHALDLEAGILQVDADGVTIFTSGSRQAREGSPPPHDSGSESGSVSGEMRFDRLAQALLTAIRAQPEDILDTVDEDDKDE
jgi:F0F1-type ATP synthase epsilon subunit